MPLSPNGNLFKRWKAPNPAMNVFRLNDDVLTDDIQSDTPAISGGFSRAQIFFGRNSHIIHVEPLAKKSYFLRTFQNFVRKWGAPLRLLCDNAPQQKSTRVLDYLRLLWIGLWNSEPHYQHQNPFERRYQTFKRIVNRTMDRTNTPPHLWFACMCYVAYVMNHSSDPSLNHKTPLFLASGRISDISAIASFRWLEPVYFKDHDTHFPSSSPEKFGYWVGVAENVGHDLTYLIWSKEHNKIIPRSCVRSALDPSTINPRATGFENVSFPSENDAHPPTVQDYGERLGRPPETFIYSDRDHNKKNGEHEETYGEPNFLDETSSTPPEVETPRSNPAASAHPSFVVLNDENGHPKLDSEGKPILIPGKTAKELKGVTFLKRQDDGSILRARVLEKVDLQQKGDKDFAKFKVKYDTTDVEDIIAYNDIMNYLHRDKLEDGGVLWKYPKIL